MSPAARTTDPDTSHAAAASVSDLREKQFAVLKVLRKRPAQGFTDEELAWSYYDHVDGNAAYPNQSESGLRTRRKELVDKGFVVDAGVKRVMSTGRMARVWKVTK